LSPGAASVCFPSKTYGMMAGGMAIITICPAWSDLADLVREMDAGWIVNNSVYDNVNEIPSNKYLSAISQKRKMIEIQEQFRGIIAEVVHNPDILLQKRKNAFYGVRENYNIDLLRNKWHSFIENL
jgi:hypothetical protein